MNTPPLAPRKTFEEILKFMPIPTFDLILYYSDKSFILVKRTIEPYKNVLALPGLRMLKSESINDTLKRIAKQEVGILLDTSNKQYVGQYVGNFKTEHNRQDISTCYAVELVKNQKPTSNYDHFSNFVISKKIPHNVGAMYRYYLKEFFSN